jgi:hypothetical protein
VCVILGHTATMNVHGCVIWLGAHQDGFAQIRVNTPLYIVVAEGRERNNDCNIFNTIFINCCIIIFCVCCIIVPVEIYRLRRKRVFFSIYIYITKITKITKFTYSIIITSLIRGKNNRVCRWRGTCGNCELCVLAHTPNIIIVVNRSSNALQWLLVYQIHHAPLRMS